MKPVAFFYRGTGMFRSASSFHSTAPPDLGNADVTALVDARQVEQLRIAAVALNETLCAYVRKAPASPAVDALQDAVQEWREAWYRIDGKVLAIGSLQPAEPSPVARAFRWPGAD